MKKIYRIKKNEEFSRIIGEKHSCSSANFVVYSSDKKKENVRVGLSVSKKLGTAVDRNRIKRQVRQMAKTLVDFENGRKDLIIIVRIPYLKNSYRDNLFDLEKLIKKAII